MFLKINDDKYTTINTDKIVYFKLYGQNNNSIKIELDGIRSPIDLLFENSKDAISTIKKLSELLETKDVN